MKFISNIKLHTRNKVPKNTKTKFNINDHNSYIIIIKKYKEGFIYLLNIIFYLAGSGNYA